MNKIFMEVIRISNVEIEILFIISARDEYEIEHQNDFKSWPWFCTRETTEIFTALIFHLRSRISLLFQFQSVTRVMISLSKRPDIMHEFNYEREALNKNHIMIRFVSQVPSIAHFLVVWWQIHSPSEWLKSRNYFFFYSILKKEKNLLRIHNFRPTMFTARRKLRKWFSLCAHIGVCWKNIFFCVTWRFSYTSFPSSSLCLHAKSHFFSLSLILLVARKMMKTVHQWAKQLKNN